MVIHLLTIPHFLDLDFLRYARGRNQTRIHNRTRLYLEYLNEQFTTVTF